MNKLERLIKLTDLVADEIIEVVDNLTEESKKDRTVLLRTASLIENSMELDAIETISVATKLMLDARRQGAKLVEIEKKIHGIREAYGEAKAECNEPEHQPTQSLQMIFDKFAGLVPLMLYIQGNLLTAVNITHIVSEFILNRKKRIDEEDATQDEKKPSTD